MLCVCIYAWVCIHLCVHIFMGVYICVCACSCARAILPPGDIIALNASPSVFYISAT